MNRIKGLTIEIGGNTVKLEQSFKNVNSAISKTQASLRDVNNLLKLNPGNTDLLHQKQVLLSRSISDTKTKLAELKRAQADMDKNGVDKNSEQYQRLQREIIATEGKLKKLNDEAVRLKYVKFEEVGQKMKKIGDGMAAVGGKLTRYVTAPIVGIATAAVKTTADFDKQMSKVKAISGATGTEFDTLRKKAIEMGAKTKFSASESGEAFQYMAMAGWKTEEMLEGIGPVLELAAASGEELGTTSDIVTDSLTAFGMQAKDSGEYVDILAAAATNTNTDVGKMGETFKYAAPAAGALGYSAKDAAIAIGLMANSGIKSSQAGTAMRAGLLSLAKPSKQAATYMDRYGISLTNTDGSMKTLREVMIEMRTKLGGLSETEKTAALTAIVGKNAFSGWAAVVNASQKDFDKTADAIDNSSGSAKKMAATMEDNLAGAITILKSNLESAAIAIGDKLTPYIRKAAEWITKMVEKFNNMDKKTQDLIVKIALIVAAIGPLLLVGGKLTSGIGGLLTKVPDLMVKFSHLKTAIAGFSAPVGIAVAAVAALVAAFVYFMATNKDFRDSVMKTVGEVVEAFKPVGKVIMDSIKQVAEAFKPLIPVIMNIMKTVVQLVGEIMKALAPLIAFIAKIVADILSLVAPILTWLLDKLQPVIQMMAQMIAIKMKIIITVIKTLLEIVVAVVTGIVDFCKKTFPGLGKFFSDTWNGIKNVFKAVWDAMKLIVETYTKIIKTVITTVWNAVKVVFSTVWNTIKTIITTAWNGIKTVVTNYINAVKTTIQTVFNTVKTIIQTVWNTIKTIITTAWNGIKTVVTNSINSVKTTIQNVLNTIKNVISTAWNGIKTVTSNIWNGIKNAVSGAINGVKSIIDNGVSRMKSIWNGIKSIYDTTKRIFNNIKDAITGPIKTAKDVVKDMINRIKGFFNFKWSFPKLKLPHFSVSGSMNPFDWFDYGVPEIRVDWYAKAMKDGMILNKPTIFGAMNGKLLGGGERGSEAVIGTESLENKISEAVSSAMNGEQLYNAVRAGAYEGTKNITITLDRRILGRELSKMGVTFNG